MENEINKEIGEFIKNRREELGLSRAEMAKALGYRLPNMVAMVETAKTTFPLKRTSDYAKILELPLHELAKVVFVKTYPFLESIVTFHDNQHICKLVRLRHGSVERENEEKS